MTNDQSSESLYHFWLVSLSHTPKKSSVLTQTQHIYTKNKLLTKFDLGDAVDRFNETCNESGLDVSTGITIVTTASYLGQGTLDDFGW